MSRPVLLLLNLPGRATYLRDYYCSKVSQADYLLPPIDLLMQSGFLAEQYDLLSLDAIALGQSPEEVMRTVVKRLPAVILFLAGAASWKEDRPFLEKLAAQCPGIRLIGMGDVFLEEGAALLREIPGVEAVLLDFTRPDLARYLAGERQALGRMIWRDGPVMRGPDAPAESPPRSYAIPVPRHELFLGARYRYPFCRRKFAVLLTDYGCPFHCDFCVMPGLGYKQRPVENVVAECRELQRLGVRDVLFLDQTFGAQPARERGLFKAIEPFRFRWAAFTRADILDEESLLLMKAAGCHTLILGVESGSETLLRAHRKGLTREQIRRAFRLCRVHRVHAVATFILGLPDETHETMAETFAFIRELRPDFCSFNVAVPRQGTPLRREVITLGLAAPETLAMDQSGARIAMRTRELTRDEVADYLHRAIRQFYFNPDYIVRRILAVRSWEEFTVLARQGWGVISRYARWKPHSGKVRV